MNRNIEGYYQLLKTWCDALLEHQIVGTGEPRLDGGFWCPACMCIHGRSHDAVYPLLCLADITGEEKYLTAAKQLFYWGEQLLCDDGSFYNDAQSDWNGITVFTVMGLYESLVHHGHILTPEQKVQMEERMRIGAAWTYRTFQNGFVTNINYHASASAALAMVGTYDHREEYLGLARKLSETCISHILEEGYLYGEGSPMEYVTKRGCRPVDIGYNAEESTPSLLACAMILQDEEMMETIRRLMKKQLDFMLPDGAWDNSFGTRNFKWTYWGSRTSDGCHGAYMTWGKEEPVFAEAARRNLELLASCTKDGLLYGGPDYIAHGEPPCIHHTFCHAKALAQVVDRWKDEKSWEELPVSLPSEEKKGIFYYPASDTWKIFHGGWIGTVTAGDFEYMKGGHSSGGTMSMLWHEAAGPVLLSSITEYQLKEPHNMQLSRQKRSHQPLTPRLEYQENGTVYSPCFDYDAVVCVEERSEKIVVRTKGKMKDKNQNQPLHPMETELSWEFSKDRIRIWGNVSGEQKEQVRLIVPVSGRTKDGWKRTKEGWKIPGRKSSEYQIMVKGPWEENPESIFFLAGGLECWKMIQKPNKNGEFQGILELTPLS